MKNPLTAWIVDFASGLRFPGLFTLAAAILVLDVLIPDMLPFVDEILLALATLAISSFRKREVEPPGSDAPGAPRRQSGPVIDVEPVAGEPESRDES